MKTTKKQNMYIGVLGLAVNEKGEFLLTQRHQPEDPEVHLQWQIPGGGMEFGETPEQTLSREMQEELGVSVRVLHSLPIARTSIWDLKDRIDHITLLCYVVSIDGQRPVLHDKETAAYKWCSIETAHELKKLPLTQDFVDEALKIVNNGTKLG